MAQLVKNLPAMQEPGFDPWVGKIPWRRERLPTPVFWPGEFHGLSTGLQRVGHDWATFTSLHFTTTRILPWLLSRHSDHHRSLMLLFYNHSNFLPWRRQWHPLQYSCLENSMEGGAWQATVHGVTKSRTRLSDFTSLILLNPVFAGLDDLFVKY